MKIRKTLKRDFKTVQTFISCFDKLSKQHKKNIRLLCYFKPLVKSEEYFEIRKVTYRRIRLNFCFVNIVQNTFPTTQIVLYRTFA